MTVSGPDQKALSFMAFKGEEQATIKLRLKDDSVAGELKEAIEGIVTSLA